jgi:hypothetical protein
MAGSFSIRKRRALRILEELPWQKLRDETTGGFGLLLSNVAEKKSY